MTDHAGNSLEHRKLIHEPLGVYVLGQLQLVQQRSATQDERIVWQSGQHLNDVIHQRLVGRAHAADGNIDHFFSVQFGQLFGQDKRSRQGARQD